MNKHRLPNYALPERYEINLDVDLDNFKYTGIENILINVKESTSELQLNSSELLINKCWIEGNNGQTEKAEIIYEKEIECVTFKFPKKINKGKWTLVINFSGEIRNDLRGFYKSKFLDKDNNENWLGTTQFEPTAARYAFPCWDEPNFKAIFSISIISDKKYLRISNEKVLEENILDHGKVETKFVDSMVMSSYLVAFVIGPLEVTEIGKVKDTLVRIVHRPGFGKDTKFAGQAALKILEFFEDYYEINYPGSKLDLIAIPDFAMGAMENIGAVTFRESLLILDEESATRSELSRSVTVIAHELAHMWFGDLVTMEWWDGIWLNEAFASLMEVISSDATYPEFKLWGDMNLSRTAGFSVDSLISSRPVEFKVESPEQAEEMFDALTYEKGSTVLRMFETFIGEEEFKKGVRSYLNKFKFQNTNSPDLWSCLTEVSRRPIDKMLPSWIHQEGFPIIQIEERGDKWKISQTRYLINGNNTEQLWMVPLKIRDLESNDEMLIELNKREVEIDKKSLQLPLINSGGWGFYYSSYTKEHLSRIAKELNNLSINEKYRLVEDTWASLRVGNVDLGLFMDIVSKYNKEEDVDLWMLISGYISTIEKILDTKNKKVYEEWVQELIEYNYKKLGFNPKEDETQEIRQLRSVIVSIKALYSGDTELIKKASELYRNGNIDKIEDGNYYNLILSLSAQDEEITATDFLDRFKNSPTPQIESRYRGVLGQVKNSGMGKVLIDAILDETIRGADSPYILSSMIANKHNGELVWELFSEKFEQIIKKMPEWTSSRVLDALPVIYKEEFGNRIIEFLENNPLPSAEKAQAQKIERLKANISFSNKIASNLESTSL
tara:strand:- start:6234 stop:8753 length:2520 start_codon:yes stop_codon:yes gene_type:complete